jgi:hypothetical protein
MNQNPTTKKQSNHTILYDTYDSRFAPRMRRPLSGRKHFAHIIVDAEKDEDMQRMKESVDIHSTTTLHVMKDGVVVSNFFTFCLIPFQNEATVATVQRKIVEKPKKEKERETVIVPMRYKIDAPEGYAPSSTNRKTSKAVSLNPSVNGGGGTGGGHSEGFPVTQTSNGLSSTAPGISNGTGLGMPGVKVDKRISSAPPGRHQKINARKVSVSKLFADIAHLDSELQVTSTLIIECWLINNRFILVSLILGECQ